MRLDVPVQRRLDVIAAVVTLLAVAGVLAYVFRDRVGMIPGAMRDITAEQTPAPQAGGPEARGPVTIDAQRQQLIGVRTEVVTRTPIAPTIRATGMVRYDETRLTEVNVKLDGYIRDLYVDSTGQPVARGQRLFTLFSPDLVATQNEYLLALKTRDELAASQATEAREYAERLAAAARQRMAQWDLPEDQMRALEESRQPMAAVTFPSPAAGFVIEKQAVKGMHVTPGQPLYTIADLSVVWVEADVYERDVSSVRVGTPASVTLDAYPGEPFAGRAIYIYPYVEEKSRTIKIRFQLPNARGRLKPGMYANVELQSASRIGLTVPADAVLDSGAQQVIFVAQGEGRFTPRAVEIGTRLGDRIEIIDGLKEGEQVATSATFFLDSESQLRAGLQNYHAPAAAAGGGAAPATSAIDIVFQAQPDPARTGDNTFEVRVNDASGAPVTGADVVVQLFMPAMPTMNMPPMRNEAKLPPVGGGVYRGPGQVMMAGRWDVTVTVTKDGQRLASAPFALVAR